MKDQPEDTPAKAGPARLVSYLTERESDSPANHPVPRLLIGVLEGTGIGPEVIGAALQVLAAAEQALELKFEVQHGRGISEQAAAYRGQGLPEDVAAFCAAMFNRGGAILNGPCGGRYVYDLRRRFDLFCKFVPVQPSPELVRVGRIVPEFLRGVDILIVRENTGGVYQGRWGEHATNQGRVAEHAFSYSEPEVRRIVEVAARAAANRRGDLHVVVKEGGVPSVTALWRDVGKAVARQQGIEAKFINIDMAAYELIQNPRRFDVIVASNLLGDVIADLAGVLLASRGVTFSGNFDAQGHGVYQTNHGCAHDLAGRDIANPAGQILSLAMMLRESFGLFEASALIKEALTEVWRQGLRTADLAEPGCEILGNKAMARRVAEEILRSAKVRQVA
jgi:3-isopropylmalate dehydrogenase